MTLKERMFYLIEKEGLNPNQFYTISGLGNGYLNNVGESFRKPTIEKIKKSFPHWNMDWILYEKGEPISNISKENIEEAVNYTLKNAKEDDIIISAGSLYMIGTVRTLLNDMIMLSY